MPASATLTRNARQRRPERATGRGKPKHSVRVTVLVAACLEGQALAADVISGSSTIATAAAVGDRHVVIHHAGRLSVRAQTAQQELRRLAGLIEGGTS